MKSITAVCLTLLFWCNIHTQIRVDKVKHFVVGNAITLISTESFLHFSKKKNNSIIFGFNMGCYAGAAKEMYDSTGRGNPDFKDFMWTCIGSSFTSVNLLFELK
jgi:hypothetical protein